MKLLQIILIAIGIAFAFVVFPTDIGYAEPSDYLYLAVPLVIILLGIFVGRVKIGRKYTTMGNNVIRSVFQLVVGIPLVTFSMLLIPTFISSLFLAPGQSEWVFYGLATILVPILVWFWWCHVKLVFSASRRGVAFAHLDDRTYYATREPLPRTAGARSIKTLTPRDGTKKAKVKMYSGYVTHGSLFLILVALTRIPLLGLVFSPLKNRVMNTAGRRMDELKEAVERLEAPTLDELLSADSRRPVLLLRSFLDDCLAIDSLDSEGKNHDTITFEELICREAADWGPVVAIGNPGEQSPPLGAARAYFSHDTWQEHAINLLDRACVTILIMGRTPSVAWELERILAGGQSSKTIVIIPPTDEEGYNFRLEQLSEITKRVSGMSLQLGLPTGHHLLAVAFTTQGSAKPIAGPFQVSLAFTDALTLGSKVVHAEAGFPQAVTLKTAS